MQVFYAGEDDVTKLIAKRIIEYSAQLEGLNSIKMNDANPRDRGTKALDKLDTVIRLSNNYPVVCVFDSDSDCVLELLKKYAPDGWKKDRLALNFAIDEGETWLMADRRSFASYFGLRVSHIPEKKQGAKELSQSIPYKTSLFFLDKLIPESQTKKYVSILENRQPGRKPATYNSVWPNYINNYWNIANACENSDSLSRAVDRTRNALKMP